PNKILGQNFLINKPTLDKIIKSADLTKDDIVLEVGPGLGTLTRELATNSKRVITIEKDKRITEILRENLKEYNNIETLEGDILKFNDYSLLTKNYKLIANIPYYLTSPLIRKFLESENKPEEIILMIQKEVAQRICSKPGDMSLLSVSVQFYAEAKIISYVSKNCFWPAPKIDSAIIKIIPKKERLLVDSDLFFTIVKAGFSHPRKQLVNNLSVLKSLNGVKLTKYTISEWLSRNSINQNQRAETLSIENWINLALSFKEIS
ncbi:MAG: ribosomal RNA small subunit methyltransferase A, partial [Candidatus Staskawiczbacteria bacterium RIFCSPHIGHO2_02_FULL_34_9]